MLKDVKSIESAKQRFRVISILFWTTLSLTIIGIMAMLIYNENLQKVSISFAIAAFGMSMSWICMSNLNNMRNDLQFELLKDEIRTQLNRIENKIDKK
jgi:hypothetical protein